MNVSLFTDHKIDDWKIMAENKYIHVVVDGELALSLPLPAGIGEAAQERVIAAFTSNPEFVISVDQVQYLSKWDGKKFTPPVK
jgi:hypothetical protein